MEILTKEQAFGADKSAMLRGIDEKTLVKNAGFAASCLIDRRYGKRPVFVMCGTGNNAADGLVVAQTLFSWGYPVTLASVSNTEKFSPARLFYTEKFEGNQIDLSFKNVRKAFYQNALFIDAVFGIGLNRAFSNDLDEIFSFLNEQKADILALDIPSGIDADTGRLFSSAPVCDATVTFCRPKPAHFLYPAKKYIGKLFVVDIGISDDDVLKQKPFIKTNPKPASLIPDEQTHKYKRGAVLIAGGEEMTGASRLCADAVLHTGAGLVKIACTKKTFPVYAQSPEHVLSVEDFSSLVTDKKINALAVGMGLGKTKRAQNIVRDAIASQKPMVLDADALFFIDKASLPFAVLTPHEGEFNRLFPDLKQEKSKIQKALKASVRTKAVIVLKGPDTIIASPDENVFINTQTTPFLATAGSGDVLAGIIAAGLASGMSLTEASCAGVWRHAHVKKDAKSPFSAYELAKSSFF